MKINTSPFVMSILIGSVLFGIDTSSANAPRGRHIAERTVTGKIDAAYQSGEIDSETALLYTVYAVKDMGKLPQRLTSDKSVRCGTLSLLEVWRNLDRVSRMTRQVLEAYLQRPSLSGPESVITTTRFKIHYTTSGSDAVSPDYADDVASYAEKSWTDEVDGMGWDAPPPDGVDGDEYDIYIMNSGGGGWVGYCQPEGEGPDPEQDDYTSHIVIATGLGTGLAQVTVAHEFNHACQFSYSASEAGFWYENCAVWMEDMVYDRVNDYINYISIDWDNPIYWPELPITTANGEYEYGAAPWVFYLTERHADDDIPRRIWERNGLVSGNETVNDIDFILSAYYGSSFHEALKEYAVWRYFVGSNDDGQHFSEGSLWIDPYIAAPHIHNSYPAQGSQGSRAPDYYGTNFIQFHPPGGGGQEGLNITFDGQDGRMWAALVAFDPGTDAVEIGLTGGQAGAISVDWGNAEAIVLVPVVLSSSGRSLSYAYSASQGSDTAPPTMEHIVEPQDQWYALSPIFSNFGFDDNINLDDGWYQLNSCVGPWTPLFTDASGLSWDDDGWVIPEFEDLPQGNNSIYFKVDDDAGHVGGGCAWSWRFKKDTIAPDVPSNVRSTSHGVGLWSMDRTIDVRWTAASDPYPGSGLDGYSYSWNTLPTVLPDYSKDIEENVVTLTSPELNDGEGYYFHIRNVDQVGNWQTSLSLGPFRIDGTKPTEGWLSIDEGADTTRVPLVTLHDIHASDAMSGLGEGAQMRFSNDGLAWSEAEVYAEVRIDWDLTAAVFGGSPHDGMKTVYVQVQDVAGNWSEAFDDTILYHPDLMLLADALADGYVGFAYSEILTTVGGDPPYLWSVISGSLPDGLSLENHSGLIFGTPQTSEVASFSIEVTDDEGTIVAGDFSITVHSGSRGDVNVDGNINVLDAILAVNILLGKRTPNAYELWAADCTGNDEVNIIDVLGIVNASLGHGSCQPTGR
jgi:hypothetical protein